MPDWASGIGAGRSMIKPRKTAVADRPVAGSVTGRTPKLAAIRSLIGTRLTSKRALDTAEAGLFLAGRRRGRLDDVDEARTDDHRGDVDADAAGQDRRHAERVDRELDLEPVDP